MTWALNIAPPTVAVMTTESAASSEIAIGVGSLRGMVAGAVACDIASEVVSVSASVGAVGERNTGISVAFSEMEGAVEAVSLLAVQPIKKTEIIKKVISLYIIILSWR